MRYAITPQDVSRWSLIGMLAVLAVIVSGIESGHRNLFLGIAGMMLANELVGLVGKFRQN